MKKLKTNAKFLEDLIIEFPELTEEVLDEDYRGKVSLQIGCLRHFTQNAIDRHDLGVVKRSFDFVDENYELVNATTSNFLIVSYIGKLQFSKNPEVENLLSIKLQDKLVQLKAYYESFEKDEALINFFNSL